MFLSNFFRNLFLISILVPKNHYMEFIWAAFKLPFLIFILYLCFVTVLQNKILILYSLAIVSILLLNNIILFHFV